MQYKDLGSQFCVLAGNGVYDVRLSGESPVSWKNAHNSAALITRKAAAGAIHQVDNFGRDIETEVFGIRRRR